jgi:hypothetical protein
VRNDAALDGDDAADFAGHREHWDGRPDHDRFAEAYLGTLDSSHSKGAAVLSRS